MQVVIGGKLYDTKTAEHLCDEPCEVSDSTNFKWHETALYRTPRGAYFVAGRGGPLTRWAMPVDGGRGFGSGIKVISELEARDICERAGVTPGTMVHAGFELEEG